jgi:hypothetical protein
VGTVIAPGGYLVITNDTFRTRSYHPTVPANKILGNFNYNLGNQGELVKLFDNNLRLSFSVHYNDTIPWPETPDGEGYTLELKQKNGMYNDGNNWETGCKLGSPGGPKVSPCQLVYPWSIGQNEIAPAISIYPNPAAQNIYFESEKDIETISVIDITGRCVEAKTVRQKQGMITGLRSGIYHLQVEFTNKSIRYQKIIVE